MSAQVEVLQAENKRLRVDFKRLKELEAENERPEKLITTHENTMTHMYHQQQYDTAQHYEKLRSEKCDKLMLIRQLLELNQSVYLDERVRDE
jgi:hypothetical protein